MIKDIVVNLSIRDARDPAMDFAISTAAAFNAHLAGAHLAGMALLYEPLMPPMVDMYGIPPEVIESQRIENEKAAKAAVARFDESARRAGLKSADTRMLDAAVASAPGLFAQVARRFDLSVVGQPEPDTPVLDRLIVEAVLFEFGPAGAGRPLHSKSRSAARSRHAVLGWQPKCRPRCRRRHAVHPAEQIGSNRGRGKRSCQER